MIASDAIFQSPGQKFFDKYPDLAFRAGSWVWTLGCPLFFLGRIRVNLLFWASVRDFESNNMGGDDIWATGVTGQKKTRQL